MTVQIDEARASGISWFYVPVHGYNFTVFADYLPEDRQVGLNASWDVTYVFDCVTNVTDYLKDSWVSDIINYLFEKYPEGRAGQSPKESR